MNRTINIQIFCMFIVLTAVNATVSMLQINDKCLDESPECNSTDYKKYVACMKRRQKRSLDCDSTCSECDCESCTYSNCKDSCDACCDSCCNNYTPCDTRPCCRQSCNTQCKSSQCRVSCRKNCEATITIVKNSSDIAKNENKVNVTTIINLNNVVNNTNIIDIPIQINNTNLQNITMVNEGYQGNSSSNCCIVIGPRQCVPHKESPYIRCFHFRTKQCGDFCTATIVHKERRRICQTIFPGKCYPKIIYIPQPQPKCRYESNWPYVSCGIKKSTSCAGCYASEEANTFMACPPECYNDAFRNGPYYTHGPFYRKPQLGNIGGYGGRPYLGYYGFGTDDNYSTFGDLPYGGLGNAGFADPAYNDFPFENLMSEGSENYSFEPNFSSPEANGGSSQFIDVGLNVSDDYARGTRNAEVKIQNKSRPTVHDEVRKKDTNKIIQLTQIIKKH